LLTEIELPHLSLENFNATQRYLIEIWVEKTTQNDILEPLARRYRANLINFMGEGSETACRAAIRRAIDAKKPLRILYISDFDPGGRSMPLAVARKIEFWISTKGIDLDAAVEPLALLPEQVEHYRLPRVPIKETERRSANFEKRFGSGAVELDALEALHPGELQTIVQKAIGRYFDPTLKSREEAAIAEIEEELEEIQDRVYDLYAEEIGQLQERYASLRRSLRDLNKEARDLGAQISASLENQELPVVSEDRVPKAPEADQEAPLFDSRRDYLTQLDWYRGWQRRSGEGQP
jgi:chaperonin cofactor prefoldin